MAAIRACEICDEPIDPERAEALPDTRLCTEHAKAIAKFGGEFITSVIQERTNKPGSLKRNYGGIDTSKSRNHEAIRKLREEFERQGQ
jgi:hypothetical protein